MYIYIYYILYVNRAIVVQGGRARLYTTRAVCAGGLTSMQVVDGAKLGANRECWLAAHHDFEIWVATQDFSDVCIRVAMA